MALHPLVDTGVRLSHSEWEIVAIRPVL